jgi:DNA mismatch repair protein MSH6
VDKKKLPNDWTKTNGTKVAHPLYQANGIGLTLLFFSL